MVEFLAYSMPSSVDKLAAKKTVLIWDSAGEKKKLLKNVLSSF